MLLGAVDGAIAAADINNDGQLGAHPWFLFILIDIEMVTADGLGNVVVFNIRGEEVWEKQILGPSITVYESDT